MGTEPKNLNAPPVAPDPVAELVAKATRDERIERFATLVLFVLAGTGLQAMGAHESIVGGAFGVAAALVRTGATSRGVLATSGAGAVVGLVMSGWDPTAVLS